MDTFKEGRSPSLPRIASATTMLPGVDMKSANNSSRDMPGASALAHCTLRTYACIAAWTLHARGLSTMKA
eukprot:2596057-Alexandrium_andersonii.AAC.1